MQNKTLKWNRKQGIGKSPRALTGKYLLLLLVFIIFNSHQVQAQIAQVPNWQETDKIVAVNRMDNAHFGHDIKTSSNHTVVGVPNQTHSGASKAGAVNVYERTGSNLTFLQELTLTSADANADDFFGYSVSISYNGKYIVVGAYGQDTDQMGQNILLNSGSVYVFTRIESTGLYNQTAKIVAPINDRESGALFGYDVDISDERIIIGAFRESHDTMLPSATFSGAAYIYKPTGLSGNWVLVEKLTASDRTAQDKFGISVAIYKGAAVVGATGNDTNSKGLDPLSNSGSAYIFEENGFSGSWQETGKITSTDRGEGENFGYSVDLDISVSHNSFSVLVGVPYDAEDENGSNPIGGSGSAFMFRKNTNPLIGWEVEDKFVANDRKSNSYFGAAVATEKGNALIGAPDNDTDESGGNILAQAGAAYLYDYMSSPVPNWGFIKKLVSTDREIGDRFGFSVDFHNNYRHCVVGAHYEDNDPITGVYKVDAGSAYIFTPFNDIVNNENETKEMNNVNDKGLMLNPSQFSVAPNPSNRIIHIETDYSINSIKVFDTLGRLVLKQNNSSKQLDISSLTTGLLFLQIETNEGSIVKRIVKK